MPKQKQQLKQTQQCTWGFRVSSVMAQSKSALKQETIIMVKNGNDLPILHYKPNWWTPTLQTVM
jgi:hypothetical protein